jgi:hypothetical protein
MPALSLLCRVGGWEREREREERENDFTTNTPTTTSSSTRILYQGVGETERGAMLPRHVKDYWECDVESIFDS